MAKLKINDIEVEVADGLSVLQACETLGIEIPRFCYHDRLSVPANCRMCLVEQVGAPKPVPSCAIKVADNMDIKTNTPLVHRARQNVMEFMLLNHPLDCPVCDQGGECDLQDQAVAFGYDRSRYTEEKRAVKDKDLGPLIKTTMTRCIHCTRCIRFAEQIGGTPDLGLLGRGEDTEVGTYIEQFLGSELSGNLVDICPVGALTSKPYEFKARPWEMRKTESIDVMDAVGSHIRIDTRSNAEVMRILPRLCEDINEEWLGDKSRHVVDGLKRQRLDQPYIRTNDTLQPAAWPDVLQTLATKLKETAPEQMAALAGIQADCESMAALKDLFVQLGSPHLDCRTDGATYHINSRADYIFNSRIAGIEQADAILLVGTFPRHEAVMINARIRKTYVAKQTPVAMVGVAGDPTYPCHHVGQDVAALESLLQGRDKFAEILNNAERPMIIVGAGALAHADGAAVQALALQLAQKCGALTENWNGYNVLQNAASRVGGLDLGFVPQRGGMATNQILQACQQGQIKLVYALGVDDIAPEKFGDAFVIYQGSHGDVLANRADIILPSAAYTETNATFVNTEGRVQHTRAALMPLGQAKDGWKIVRALSDTLGKALPYNNLADIRQRLVEMNNVFATPNSYVPAGLPNVPATIGKYGPAPLARVFDNYYQTCAISRASQTMAQCTAAFVNKTDKKMKAA